jgi:hypothetical protein
MRLEGRKLRVKVRKCAYGATKYAVEVATPRGWLQHSVFNTHQELRAWLCGRSVSVESLSVPYMLQ